MSAKRPVAQTIEDLEFLDESGSNAVEAAERLGFATTQAMYQWLRENDAHDLWLSLHKRDPEGADLGRRFQPVAAVLPSTLDAILDRAAKSPRPRLVKRGEKIREQLGSLRADLDAVEAEDRAKAAAREEVARLERQLAEAKAKLRGAKGEPTAATSVRRSTAPKGEYPCRNEPCAEVYDTPQGRSMHERLHCQHREEVAS